VDRPPSAGRQANTIAVVELRRAILLFAVVLGLAALVSSVARPPGGDEDRAEQPATTVPAPAAAGKDAKTPQPTTIDFRVAAKPVTQELEVGQPATVLVDVQTPGQIDIPSLGLTEPAEPLTPAMFEVLASSPGSHPIVVQPAALEGLPSKVGTLKVVPAS
jgi:hypothetical protein